MKTITALTVALSVAILSLTAASATPRTWTSSDGKQIEAELLEVLDDSVKIQVTATRKVFTLPLEKLSEEDQKFVAEEKIRLDAEASEEKLSSRSAKWTEDWEEAKAEAKEYDLPILLLFTGSDWCGYCIQLEKNVFSEGEFEDFADKNLVLMKADFPRGSQSSSTKKQNAELKKQFSFGGYPTVFLLDKDEEVIGQFGGYGGDSPEKYISKLEAKIED